MEAMQEKKVFIRSCGWFTLFSLLCFPKRSRNRWKKCIYLFHWL